MPRSPGSSFRPSAAGPAASVKRFFARRRIFRRIPKGLLIGWVLMAAFGWLSYLPFVSGAAPGVHGLAWAYSQLLLVALLALLTLIASGLAAVVLLCLLLPLSLKPQWQQKVRQGLAKVGLLAAAGGLGLLALWPALMVGYAPQAQQAVAPWGITYRTVYAAFPIDDNYGELLLLSCRFGGLCQPLYQGPTDVISAAGTAIEFDVQRDQLGLNLAGQWVYVRSRQQEICRTVPSPQAVGEACRFASEAAVKMASHS
jgi:hypothetical protein